METVPSFFGFPIRIIDRTPRAYPMQDKCNLANSYVVSDAVDEHFLLITLTIATSYNKERLQC